MGVFLDLFWLIFRVFQLTSLKIFGTATVKKALFGPLFRGFRAVFGAFLASPRSPAGGPPLRTLKNKMGVLGYDFKDLNGPENGGFLACGCSFRSILGPSGAGCRLFFWVFGLFSRDFWGFLVFFWILGPKWRRIWGVLGRKRVVLDGFGKGKGISGPVFGLF